MLQLPIKDVIDKIKQDTGLSEEEIQNHINSKMQSLEGLVSEEGAAYIVASELGVSLFKDAESGSLKIKNVLAGMNNVEVVGKVIRVRQPITFVKNNKQGEVASIVIADESGTIRITFWDKQVDLIKTGKIKEGAIVKIKDAYAKESSYSGRELHTNSRSKIIVDPEGIDITLQGPAPSQSKKISEILPQDRAKVLATVVRIFKPRFYLICPDCNKKVSETDEGAICSEHKVVTPKSAMVLNFVLDDGTDTMRAVAFGNTAEQLISLSASEAKEILTNDGEINLQERFDDFLLGKTIEVEGRMNENKAFDRVEFQVMRSNLSPDARTIATNLLKGE